MNTHTMNRKTAKQLIKGLPLNIADISRLILECTEELDNRIEGLNKNELIKLIRNVFRAGITVLQEKEKTVSFEQAAWDSIKAREGRRPTTKRDLRHFVRRMLKIKGFAERPLRLVTVRECSSLLENAFGKSLSSYRKGRVILHSIFAHGIRQGWVDQNPVDCISAPVIKERKIIPLLPEEIGRLEKAVVLPEHKDMRLSLYLMLYCGIRPSEIQRLDITDICWREHQVIIRSNSSKTGGGRMVPMRKLPKMKREECRIPRNWANRWRALRREAGFARDWVTDVCRHTFASYHASYFHNLPALQIEMGHRDVSLLWSRYVSPVHRTHAQVFWQT